MGQFFTHTLTTVIANKYMNFMSIGFFVVELLVIDDEDRFCVFEESAFAAIIYFLDVFNNNVFDLEFCDRLL